MNRRHYRSEPLLWEVRGIIADYLYVDIEEVAPGANLRRDLAIDSLDLVELSAIFEEQFGCVCYDHTHRHAPVQTVEEIARFVLAHHNGHLSVARPEAPTQRW